MTIPLHVGCEIGPPLFPEILRQLAISLEEFERRAGLNQGQRKHER